MLGWLATAAAAITAGVFAIGAIGNGIAGSTTSPLSDQAVAKALAQATQTPAPSSRTPTSRPSATRGTTTRESRARVLQVGGGSVVAGCAGGQATLQSWTPDQGYEVDDVQRGPNAVVRVKFKSGRSEFETRIGCRGDVPIIVRARTDDH